METKNDNNDEEKNKSKIIRIKIFNKINGKIFFFK